MSIEKNIDFSETSTRINKQEKWITSDITGTSIEECSEEGQELILSSTRQENLINEESNNKKKIDVNDRTFSKKKLQINNLRGPRNSDFLKERINYNSERMSVGLYDRTKLNLRDSNMFDIKETDEFNYGSKTDIVIKSENKETNKIINLKESQEPNKLPESPSRKRGPSLAQPEIQNKLNDSTNDTLNKRTSILSFQVSPTSRLSKNNDFFTKQNLISQPSLPKKTEEKRRSSIAAFFKNFGASRKSQVFPEDKSKKGLGSLKTLSVYTKVIDAVTKFKNFIKYKRIQNLSSQQLDIINDWSYGGHKRVIEEKNETNTIFKNFFSHCNSAISRFLDKNLEKLGCNTFDVIRAYFSSISSNIKVFNPKSRWKMIWDLSIMVLIFWNFMIISIAICFGQDVEDVFIISDISNKHDWYYLFILASFLNMIVDIIFELNTSYYEMGELVTNRKKIIKNYFRSYFTLDLVAEISFFCQIISYHLELDPDKVKYLNCLFLLKYYNLRGVFKSIEEFLALDDKNEAFFSLMQLFGKIFFIAHILGCLWHSVAYFGQTEVDQTWLNQMNLCQNTFWPERYIYSIYFALTTMTTVGYGDILPKNQLEVVLAMFTMLIGSAMFGYSINSIGELLKKMANKENQLKKDLTLLDRYMKFKKIDYELQTRARKYLEFVWSEEKILNQENADEILQKLSSNIREEVLLQSNGKFLKNYPMLFKNFSEKTMRKLINLIKPIRYSPQEIIIEEKDKPSNPNLYLIAQGEIELCHSFQRSEGDICRIKTLQAGSSFGQVSFFTDLPQDLTARSLNFSTVYTLSKKEFLSVISDNKEDWEKFCMIRDKILLYEDYDEVYMKCYSCEEKHLISKCPALMYFPNKLNTLHRHKIRIKKRLSLRRKLQCPRSILRFNALKDIKNIQARTKEVDISEDMSSANFETENSFNDTVETQEPQPVKEENTEATPVSLAKRNIDGYVAKQRLSMQLKSDSYSSPFKSKKLEAPTSEKKNEDIKTIEKPEIKENQLVNKALQSSAPTEFRISDEPDPDNTNKENNSNDLKHEGLFLMNFDSAKTYQNYFINNNPEVVIYKISLKSRTPNKRLFSKMLTPSRLPTLKFGLFPNSPRTEVPNSNKNSLKLDETSRNNWKRVILKKNFFDVD